MTCSCETCRHYRGRSNVTEILARELQKKPHEVNSEMTDSKKNDDVLFQAEQREEERLAREKRQFWLQRPRTMAYCGIYEVEGKYAIPRVKNPSSQCLDHRPGQPEAHCCDTCVHCQLPTQYDADAKQLNAVAWAEGWSKVFGQGLLQGARGDTQKSQDSELGFAASKALRSPTIGRDDPRYFSTCQRMATAKESVLCAHANAHDACPFWIGKKDQSTLAEVEKWKAAFVLRGIHFRQDYGPSGEPVLIVYGVAFNKEVPVARQYNLNQLQPGDCCRLGDTGKMGIRITEHTSSRLYQVEDVAGYLVLRHPALSAE